MARRPPQIVAFGGGGFSMEAGNPRLDDYVLSLTGRARPRVCFVPTASGDADHYVVRFYRAFAAARCEPSHVSLFRRDRGAGAVEGDLAAHLLAQDLIYVGGGSVLSLLGTWRAHGLDAVLAEAWRRGTVLCGLSAGSLCWFAEAVTAFHGAPTRVQGLGLLPHSNCVHYDGEPARRTEFRRFVGDGMRAGYAAEDGVGLHFVARTCTGSSPRGPAGARIASSRTRTGPWRRSRWRRTSSARPRRRRAGRRRMTAPTVLALGGGGFTCDEGAPPSTTSSWIFRRPGPADPLPAHRRRGRGAADRALPRGLRRPGLRARRPLALPARPPSGGRWR